MRAPVLALVTLIGCASPTAGQDTGDEGSGTGSESSEATSDEPSTEAPTTGDETEGSGCAAQCAGDQACVGGDCVDVGLAEIERGCSPLADPAGRGQCLYPWPSSLYAVADPATATGLRVNYDAELLPKNSAGQAFAVADMTNDVDGFSPSSQIRVAFAGGVEAADLPGVDDIAGSLAEGSPIVLLEAETGERWPLFAELDATAQKGEPMTLFIRPMKRLNYDRRYVVAIRGLRDAEGGAIEPPPLFRALRDHLSTDVPQLEALRGSYVEIFAALEQAKVERSNLQLAWDFRTASADRMQRDLVEISPQVVAKAGAGDLGYVIEEVELAPSAALAKVIRGRFTVPSCLAGDAGPGAVMQRAADGAPDCSGTTEAPFVIAVPQAVVDAGEPAPFVVYGHGLLGTGEEAVGIAERATSVIVAGTDFWGMAEEDIPRILQAFGENFIGGNTVPDRLLQASVNFTSLAYLGAGDLVDEAELSIEVDGTPQSLIDPAEVHYLGGSQGGIMGGTVLAMAPNLRRGILVVGGANYSLMIWRSTAFALLAAAWAGSHPDPQEREFLFALVQSAFDRADPAIHAELIAAPPGGGEAKRLLLIESIGDCQVPNIATETLARTHGMPMLTPGVTAVWGVADADGPLQTGSALLQVDTKHMPLPPVGNLPPPEDNGAHGSAVDDPALLAVIEGFIFAGVAENLCDGPCDPG